MGTEDEPATGRHDAPPPAPGTPRWAVVVAALVPAAALVWAIVSYFIPKPEPAREHAPDAARATPAPAPGAPVSSMPNVSGSGNVVAGQISGGTFNLGGAPAPAPASPRPLDASAGK